MQINIQKNTTSWNGGKIQHKNITITAPIANDSHTFII